MLNTQEHILVDRQFSAAPTLVSLPKSASPAALRAGVGRGSQVPAPGDARAREEEPAPPLAVRQVGRRRRQLPGPPPAARGRAEAGG